MCSANALFTRFQQRIDNLPYRNFLLAFSGGLDSGALLSLFTKLRENRPHFSLRAIHIHHGLSPNADDWAAHCTQFCHRLNVPLHIERVQVTRENGIEAGAREARYSAIGRHLHNDEILVTAHHLQDQTETFLLALKRGSGIQGLGAMQMQSSVYNLPVLRPLLDFTRTQLEKYMQAENLPWIDDESNADNRYERNFLRNIVLPQLRARWPYFDYSVQRSAQHCFEQQQLIYELLVHEFRRLYDTEQATLDISDFVEYSVVKQRALLRMWLAEKHMEMPSLVQLDQLLRDAVFARADAMPQFRLHRQVIRRYQHKLYLTPQFADIGAQVLEVDLTPSATQYVPLPDGLGGLYVERRTDTIVFRWCGHIVRLPLTKQPIQIRFAYSGKVRLKNHPFHEEIKKVWQQLGVPPWQRNRIPLIFYGESLKSAVGFFTVL